MNDPIVSIRMSQELKEYLQKEAELEHRSLSQHVSKILSDYTKD